MQQAVPYRTWVPSSTSGSNSSESRTKLVAENAVIVFGRRGCCMCHVVKRLLLGLGVNPPVVEVEESEEAAAIDELSRIGGVGVEFPAVFVGGKFFGGLERVVGSHISGELVPILKQAGALWL